MKFQTKTIVNGENVANSITSGSLNLEVNFGVFVQAILTGSPSGDIVLQASTDEVNWVDIDKVTISGSQHYINKDAIYAPYIRVYKAAGGTGTLTIKATIKGA
jgi:hypothetical protein